MAKEWMITQWIKEQIGIKNPAKEMVEKDVGKYLAEGFAEGIKKGMDKMDMSTMSAPIRDDHTVIDPLLEKIDRTVWNQQVKVLASGKYPHPIHKDNHTAREWMDHQMSEFADALVYHECMSQTIDDVINDLHVIQDALAFGLTNREKAIAKVVDRALSRLERGDHE